MKYTSYTEEDFIMDEYFQKWILDGDSAAREFWENWLRDNPDKKELAENAADFIRMVYTSESHQSFDSEVDAIFEKIGRKKEGPNTTEVGNKSGVFSIRNSKLWIAASCAVLVISVWTWDFVKNSNNPKEAFKSGGNEVTLKMEDGTVRVLNENASKIITNSMGEAMVNQNRNLLIYDTKTEKKSKIRYNELVVPYGKKFEIRLSDGSHVHLNSGSKLRYPMRFVKGTARTVYLDGEAYFSIEKDSLDSFVVVAKAMVTKVYGTKFNVSNYTNDENAATVLVEGSVGVYRQDSDTAKKIRTLVPGERAKLKDGKILVDLVNVEKYIAWTEGRLFFADDRFELILKKMERHFDLVIENKMEELNGKRFTGTFMEETVDQIFKVFQAHTPFKYSVREDTITIYRKV